MSRFIPSGKAKVVFAAAVSNINAPTQAEITAGTVLSTPGTYTAAGLKEATGFETASSFVETPDVSSKIDTKIPGRQSLGDAALTFYDDDASMTIRTALAEGTSGYVIIMRNGQGSGKRADVFPITVAAVNSSPVNAENNPAMFTVQCAITALPAKETSQAA